jgi:hypothetical protein
MNDKSLLQRLTEKIPGYSGYNEKETRRDVDKLHREHIADRLRELKEPLVDLMRRMTDSGKLQDVDLVDIAIRRIDRLENKVRFASYGYSGFFDVTRVGNAELDRIYSFDLELTDDVDELSKLIGAVKTDQSPGGVEQVQEFVDQLEEKFEKRQSILDGTEGTSSSMFNS